MRLNRRGLFHPASSNGILLRSKRYPISSRGSAGRELGKTDGQVDRGAAPKADPLRGMGRGPERVWRQGHAARRQELRMGLPFRWSPTAVDLRNLPSADASGGWPEA